MNTIAGLLRHLDLDRLLDNPDNGLLEGIINTGYQMMSTWTKGAQSKKITSKSLPRVPAHVQHVPKKSVPAKDSRPPYAEVYYEPTKNTTVMSVMQRPVRKTTK